MGGLEPYENDEPVVTFLYLLLRDHVSPGVIEGLVCEVEVGAARASLLTNAYLAEYANNISDRLIRATELRMKAQAGELHRRMAPPVLREPPHEAEPVPTPLSEAAKADNEHSRERQRIEARAGAEGRLRAWVNAPMTIPLSRVIQQAFEAAEEGNALGFDLSEVLETVTILTDFAVPGSLDE
jgi:hypothetical protein